MANHSTLTAELVRTWQSNLGNALKAVGALTVAGGVLPQLAGAHSELYTVAAWTGFISSILGQFFGVLFPPVDAKGVKQMLESHTDFLRKEVETTFVRRDEVATKVDPPNQSKQNPGGS